MNSCLVTWFLEREPPLTTLNLQLQYDVRSANQGSNTVRAAPFPAAPALRQQGTSVTAPVPKLGLVSVPFVSVISLSKSYCTKLSALLLRAVPMVLLMCSTAFEASLPICQTLTLFQSLRASEIPAEAPLGMQV